MCFDILRGTYIFHTLGGGGPGGVEKIHTFYLFFFLKASLRTPSQSQELKTFPNHHFFGDNLKRTLLKYQKGGGNDGEPDASQKLEFEKNDKNWLESKNCGRFGIRIENIQSDSSKEVRGQS